MIAIIDYGAGNLFSVQNALNYLGLDGFVTGDASGLERADKLILPGVGAFSDAMQKLEASGLVAPILAQVKKGKPLLGICLGMQLLFEEGTEFTKTAGLGLLKGSVELMHPGGGAKVPHMGWNALEVKRPSKLTEGVCQGDAVYFVHSYQAVAEEAAIIATCEHGGLAVPALVGQGNVYGAQFHPEKSGSVGLVMLKNFGRL